MFVPNDVTYTEIVTHVEQYICIGENIRVVIRIRTSNVRQHNGRKKKGKQRSSNITHKTKNQVTRTH